MIAIQIGGKSLETNDQQAGYQCIGCGALIQTESPDRFGYLPASAFKKGLEKGDFYCQRCFRLRHYNELSDLELDEDFFLDKLRKITDDQALIIHVIDIFDIEGSLLTSLPRLLGQDNIVVIANKVDLLPKSVNRSRLTHWLMQYIRSLGLKPKQVILASGKQANGIEGLVEVINHFIQDRDIYLVGITNVGKSTLLNRLIQHYGGDQEVITTSNHPGTTLDLIRIPLSEEYGLVDTPGFVKKDQWAHYLSRKSYGQVIPQKPIKPRVFQLNPKQTLFLAGLCQIDFVEGERASFILNVANDLYLHRSKLEKAADFYKAHCDDLLMPPTAQERGLIPQWQAHHLTVKSDQDLVIPGLGWIAVNERVQVNVQLPKGMVPVVRPSMI